MEVMTVFKLGIINGVERKKITFTNPTGINIMKNAQSHFTKDQKKEARLSHKRNNL